MRTFCSFIRISRYIIHVTTQRLPIHDRLMELADPTRSRLLSAIERQELTVGELATALRLPQSTVSRHLRILADQGWAASRAEGTSRWYRLHPQLFGSMLSLWNLVREAHVSSAGALQDAARVDAVLAARRSVSQNFFDSASAEWDALRSELFGARADLLGALALLDPSLVVGDLGCGTGALSAALAPHVARVYAVDASPAMLSAAADRLSGFDNVMTAKGLLEALPIESGELDAAVIMLVLHHVTDPLCALREVHRVLRPGGRLLLVDMQSHAKERYRETMGHVWLGFDESAVGSWLTEAGFVSVRYRALPAAPAASGPALFTCTAVMMPDPVMVVA